jgi:glutamine amidotransferase
MLMLNVALIDYGIGNMFSVEYALRRFSLNVEVCSSPNIRDIDAVVIPGVGNFRVGAGNLRKLKNFIVDLVKGGVPVLGICLGMQILFQRSEEDPSIDGLGLLSGKVVKLPGGVKTPHIGWNNVTVVRYVDFLDGIDEGDYFYFAHSYYAVPDDLWIVAAETDYGVRFPSVIVRNNVFGVQFHPEKSGRSGEKIIKNFINIAKR